tara:strand:- start:2770 stop:2931 length:162 start_codon:yes stop_codon:yes gene_type:complete
VIKMSEWYFDAAFKTEEECNDFIASLTLPEWEWKIELIDGQEGAYWGVYRRKL